MAITNLVVTLWDKLVRIDFSKWYCTVNLNSCRHNYSNILLYMHVTPAQMSGGGIEKVA